MHSSSERSLAALLSCPGIGHGTLAHIQNCLQKSAVSWEEFWRLPMQTLAKIGIPERTVESIEKLKKEHTVCSYEEYLLERDIRVVDWQSPEYPPLLLEIENPPQVLFLRGSRCALEHRLPVAVVGTRHMTGYGKVVTEKITGELVAGGAVIVSGFMYGVDSCAHAAALAADGCTVGILGFGFNHMYPASQKLFFEHCLSRGMSFISPFSPQVRPTRGNFPARNMIVAGMSAAVVVTEAGDKSGSHITATCAGEAGRVVCAVPSPITSHYSVGTKTLVNEGAVLVDSGSDVFAACGYEPQRTTARCEQSEENTEISVEPLQARILSLLSEGGGQSTSQIAATLSCSSAECSAALSYLELSGSVIKQQQTWQVCP